MPRLPGHFVCPVLLKKCGERAWMSKGGHRLHKTIIPSRQIAPAEDGRDTLLLLLLSRFSHVRLCATP